MKKYFIPFLYIIVVFIFSFHPISRTIGFGTESGTNLLGFFPVMNSTCYNSVFIDSSGKGATGGCEYSIIWWGAALSIIFLILLYYLVFHYQNRSIRALILLIALIVLSGYRLFL